MTGLDTQPDYSLRPVEARRRNRTQTPVKIMLQQAFETATRKAIKGHKDWIVWEGRNGEGNTALCTADAIKAALLAHGTQKHFWRISKNTGQGQIVKWRLGLRMLRNCRRGFDGPACYN